MAAGFMVLSTLSATVAGGPGTHPFTDVTGSPFEPDIAWAYNEGITFGCSADGTLFCPKASVTRAQMASFLARGGDLPAATQDHFADDETSVHEGDINGLREAGITTGCGTDTTVGSATFGRPIFCPSQAVTRAQMASFIARALDLPAPSDDYFDDDASSVHQGDINRLSEAGITTGCGVRMYCPDQPVLREQMAAFLHRALNRLTIAWEESAPFDGRPAELMVDGETWVAAGWATERGPAAWTSPDARTWDRADVPDPEPNDRFLGWGLGPTVRLGDSLLSYGSFVGGGDGRGVNGWGSTDGGRSWEVIESDSALVETGYVVNELIVGEPALVAVEGRHAEFIGRIWRWTEETSWVETTPETAGTEEPSRMQTEDVVWADGRYVVVGSRGDPFAVPGSRGTIGTSWISTDGQSWQESTPIAEFGDVALRQVAPMPGGGFVALGISDADHSGNNGVPVAFTSPDGLAWTPAAAPPAEPGIRPEEILVTDGGLVALGDRAATVNETLVWTSVDGHTWTNAGRLDHGFAAAAVRRDQLVVFTADRHGDGGFDIHRGTLGP